MKFLERFADLDGQGTALSGTDIFQLEQIFALQKFTAGQLISRQGEVDGHEYLLIQGRARSLVRDSEGREVSLNFYVAPCVITPNMARTADGTSLVDIEMVCDGEVMICKADALLKLMVAHEGIREWGNGIMREALSEKVGREWCLSALDALDRLRWFRANYPGYEQLFSHAHIASHLAMTPVTLSRLRNPKAKT